VTHATRTAAPAQDKRQQLADLLDIQRLIQQLKSVQKAPEALRRFVKQRDYGSAVLLYSNMQPLLQAHGHVGFLRPISDEAHEIMQVQPRLLSTPWPAAAANQGASTACAGHT
jgi:hypothetical protein